MNKTPDIDLKDARQKLFYPRLTRTDRFPTSCSVINAISQLEQLGVDVTDIRLILEDRRKYPNPQILSQSPAPGSPVRHGVEVKLSVALDGLVNRFPENLFVSLPAEEGRLQLEQARRLFSPFDKAALITLARLRKWSAVFSMADSNQDFEEFIFDLMGLESQEADKARLVFSPKQLQIWLQVMPLLSRIVGDCDQIRRVLRHFYPADIDIAIEGDVVQNTTSGTRWRLADTESSERSSGPNMGTGLGSAVLGNSVTQGGSLAVITCSKSAAGLFRKFSGVKWGVESLSGGDVQTADLGAICAFDDMWQTWSAEDGGRPSPEAKAWLRLLYLLQYLLPAGFCVKVRAVPDANACWKISDIDAEFEDGASRLGMETVLGG